MMKILAAIDETPVAAAVAAAAAAIAGLLDDDLDVIHVTRAGADPLPTASHAVTARALPGDPATVIAAAAGEPDVDLLVIGARGPALAAKPAGHVTIDVIRHTSRPVVVVPPQWHSRRPAHVVAAFEHDRPVEPVVEHLLGRFATGGATIRGIHVIDPEAAPAFWEGAGHHADAWSDEFLARCSVHASSLDVCYGPPDEWLSTVVATTDADLVVLVWAQELEGGHGNVVRAVLERSEIPVLLVPTLSAKNTVGIRHASGPK